MAGGCQEIEPEVLFRVTPAMTAGLTLVSMLPALASLWRHRDGWVGKGRAGRQRTAS